MRQAMRDHPANAGCRLHQHDAAVCRRSGHGRCNTSRGRTVNNDIGRTVILAGGCHWTALRQENEQEKRVSHHSSLGKAFRNVLQPEPESTDQARRGLNADNCSTGGLNAAIASRRHFLSALSPQDSSPQQFTVHGR
jgi:hypothetical protein